MFASTVEMLAALAGLLAASIVIGGFLAHVRPALAGEPEVELRRATAMGGLAGVIVALALLAGLRVVRNSLSAEVENEMSEKQALILLLLGAIVAVFAVMAGIKLLGGDQELMAIAGMVIMCITAWESAGVVMRYSDKDDRR